MPLHQRWLLRFSRQSKTWSDGLPEYITQVLDGTITANQWIEAACQRHQDDLKDGDKRGLYFDQEEGQRFVAFRALPSPQQGPMGWPALHAASLAAVHDRSLWMEEADGTRRFRTLFCAVGRKNGKSALCSGLGLALLDFDREPGAEVYWAAVKRDQARICHVEAERMVKASPHLKKRIGIHRNNLL